MRPNLQETADLVTFTEEILNGKLHFFTVIVFGKETNLSNKYMVNNRNTRKCCKICSKLSTIKTPD